MNAKYLSQNGNIVEWNKVYIDVLYIQWDNLNFKGSFVQYDQVMRWLLFLVLKRTVNKWFYPRCLQECTWLWLSYERKNNNNFWREKMDMLIYEDFGARGRYGLGRYM